MNTRKPAPLSLWEEPREITKEEAAARTERRRLLTEQMMKAADIAEANIATYTTIENIEDAESFTDAVAIELYNRAFRRGFTR